MLLGIAEGIRRLKDLDCLGDRFEFLRPQLLFLLEGKRLLLALSRNLFERLLIGGLGCLGGFQLLFVCCLLARLPFLLLCLLFHHFCSVFDGIGQVHDDHVMSVLGVLLFLLSCTELLPELVLQLFQHVDDAAGLELIGIRFRSFVVHAAQGAFALLQKPNESLHDGMRLLRHHPCGSAAGELQERRRGRGPVIVFLGEDPDRALEGIHALREVGFGSEEVLVILRTLLLVRLEVCLVAGFFVL
mmetsp:Transcript_10056/g.25167  ORF Transcript_10056/g.25167 Transcript_10056/m.25167 type:complete len:244 (+) Transcript_10056:1218-1949(+)